jgi:hypothetical protein
MKCIETRRRLDGIKRRTYVLPNGRKVRTYEVPPQVLHALGRKKLTAALETARRVEASNARQDLIKQRIAEGVKPAAIAHEFGVTEQRVRQLRQQLKAKT